MFFPFQPTPHTHTHHTSHITHHTSQRHRRCLLYGRARWSLLRRRLLHRSLLRRLSSWGGLALRPAALEPLLPLTNHVGRFRWPWLLLTRKMTPRRGRGFPPGERWWHPGACGGRGPHEAERVVVVASSVWSRRQRRRRRRRLVVVVVVVVVRAGGSSSRAQQRLRGRHRVLGLRLHDELPRVRLQRAAVEAIPQLMHGLAVSLRKYTWKRVVRKRRSKARPPPG